MPGGNGASLVSALSSTRVPRKHFLPLRVQEPTHVTQMALVTRATGVPMAQEHDLDELRARLDFLARHVHLSETLTLCRISPHADAA